MYGAVDERGGRGGKRCSEGEGGGEGRTGRRMRRGGKDVGRKTVDVRAALAPVCEADWAWNGLGKE